jgi:CRISPR-associated protein (TIGR03985 family)
MTNQTFDYRPSVELLQILARGSLRQNLPKAIRLWVILRSLYGDESDPVRLQLGGKFTYSDWHKLFFTQTDLHHKNYTIPIAHDSKCPCGKTLSDWLFDPNIGFNSEEWREDFLKLYPLSEGELNNLLSEGIIPEGQINGQKRLPSGRLFAVTSKNLQYNLQTLAKLGWLELSQEFYEVKSNQKSKSKQQYRGNVIPRNSIYSYQKVTKLPKFNLGGYFDDYSKFIAQPDCGEIANNYLAPINGIQRFVMHVEYVVSQESKDRTSDFQEQLKQVWQEIPVCPISIIYDSASLAREGKRIIYPVCIYYFQRASYLCSFGQTPKKKDEIGWYNYRLDRIKELIKFSWDDQNIPRLLKEKFQQNKLPLPSEIEESMAKAWGFDFYKPSRKMLLRFERDFHDRYIINSFRHETFKLINGKAEFRKFIQDYQPNLSEKELLDEICHSLPLPPDDPDFPYAYYTADYRIDDNNAIMRLRAWGQKVEVLLPGELRQRMAKDVLETYRLYHN